ncbi:MULTISPECIES: hypothetical protein [Halomicrobium]|uniref:Uncharacterized protein n=2 Tax=Halomicrobium mukohataei TaxID=57705 RepID=C7P135_HALMD|nr:MULTISPECIES: hypothetical protein [Halomicrobium]ACV49050.1 conserved hypothetical protein [Halomicrobium mukohataei DSM 12286]QCD64470.1 hypothetical protein E5139_02010 [Halomicrobium mukohataei]QFR19276.1 hypothetical protein GBQ70_02010 [Halomicrobium sp. ZPS1]
MSLVHAVVGLFAGFFLFGPAIYAGLEVIPEAEAVTYPEATATALVGLLLAGTVDFLLGWIPVLGVVLSPLVWSAVVRRFCHTTWPASLAVGFGTWALSTLLFAAV